MWGFPLLYLAGARIISGMVMRNKFGYILIFSYILCGAVFAADLSANEIRSTITNKRILLETRFGVEFPLFYRANGSVTGDGRGTGLGKYFAPKETGRWWLKSNKLCQQFPTWNKNKITCFRLESLGGRKLIWKRDDGKSGRARIG